MGWCLAVIHALVCRKREFLARGFTDGEFPGDIALLLKFSSDALAMHVNFFASFSCGHESTSGAVGPDLRAVRKIPTEHFAVQ